MTLRERLSLFFVAIVVVPLIGAAVVVGMLVPRELNERVDERLRGAASAVGAVRAERIERAARDVARVARALNGVPAVSRASRLAAARNETGLDFLTFGDAVVQRDPRFLNGFSPSLSAGADGVLIASAPMPGGGVLSGGWFTDAAWAKLLSGVAGVGVSIHHGERLIARASMSKPDDVVRSLKITLGGGRNSILLSSTRPHSDRGLAAALVGIGGVGLILACVMGVLLARAMARPMTELSAQASAIAAGDYSMRVAARGRDEVATLARTINAMSDSVQEYVGELRQSRDELRRTLERLGATLRSTRGMEEMLASVLEGAASTLGAEAGALFRLQPDGTLSVEATIGFEAAQVTREAAGVAVRRGMPILLPGLGGDDPLGRVVAAAPLYRGDEVVGALAIASGAVASTFEEQDLSMLSSFAAQASVAIDNVFLREQAQMLARTDPLTGIANRRAMEEMLMAELERSHRYGGSLSVIMIDLDHFKSINDRCGHQEGDRVLAEAAQRIGSVLRTGVDIVARYGGEEFVVVLPETDGEGAVVVAEKILSAMSSTPFDPAGGMVVTCSAGVATVPGDGPGASDVLHAADLALYEAKERGRNCVMTTAAVTREVAPA